MSSLLGKQAVDCGLPPATMTTATTRPCPRRSGLDHSAPVTAFSALDPALARDPLVTRLDAIRTRIANACRACGRDPDSVRLLPVAKTVPADRLRVAHAAGCSEFGENKVQEAAEKARTLSDLALRWCLIGHLQSNKASLAARVFDEFQALDSLRLAEILDRHLQAEGRSMDVLIEVNTSGEASKFGLAPDAVEAMLPGLRQCTALRPRGLMTLAAAGDPECARACFRRLRDVRDRLRPMVAVPDAFDQLSMGMSGDFEIAIAEGATVVRIGQAIFGPRAAVGP